MCKNPDALISATKRDYPTTFALYKGNELDGLCVICNGVLGIAYSITSEDELSYFSKGTTKNVTNFYEFVRRLFGVDKELRSMYRVARC